MPAYHCGVEVQAVIDAGFRVEFYGVRPDLSVDLDDLERRLSQHPGPVFVIHYFGGSQPDLAELAALCQRHGVPLVEDCAHGLFSRDRGQPLGASAPVAVFSFRKALPLCEGGSTRIDEEQLERLGLRAVMPAAARRSFWPYRFYARRLARGIVGERLAHVYSRRRQRAAPIAPSFQDGTRYDEALSAVTWRVAASCDPAQVVSRRRANWIALDRRLKGVFGYRNVWTTLADGWSPWCFSLFVHERDALASTLIASGIGCFAWGEDPHPALDASRYPAVAETRRRILCLPVHQQLSESHMDRIADVLTPLLARHACRD
jgi:dTDP-4-amino-4,6-dideoxygalactose transaminase